MEKKVKHDGLDRLGAIVCRGKHLSCDNCDQGKYSPIGLITLLPDEKREQVLVDEPIILYVRRGTLTVSLEKEKEEKEEKEYDIPEGKLFIIPLAARVGFRTREGASFLLWRVENTLPLCESLDPESLSGKGLSPTAGSVPLEANPFIRQFFSHLILLFEEGFRCSRFLDLKLSELLMLLRSFYPVGVLAGFFLPLFSSDASFKRMVMKHYHEAKTVKKLASKANFSSNGFYLHFKKVIGKSPSVWMNEEKVKQVYKELKFTEKPLKQIWQEMGFSSASHFNRFCRKNLDDTPAGIRKSWLEHLNQ